MTDKALEWKEICKITFNPDNYHKCLNAVKQNGWKIQYIPEDKLTEELCLTAVKQNGYAIKFIRKDKRTEEICIIAIEKEKSLIQYISEKHRKAVENYLNMKAFLV